MDACKMIQELEKSLSGSPAKLSVNDKIQGVAKEASGLATGKSTRIPKSSHEK